MGITKSTVAPIGIRSGIHASDPKSSPSITPKTGTGKGGFTYTDTGGLFGQYGAGGNVGGTGGTGGTSNGTGSTGSGGSTGWFSGSTRNVNLETRPTQQPLSPEDIEKRYGIKGKFGSVFTGELEGMFRTLGEWEDAANPDYDIFSDGLPGNVGEAYMGLSQALASEANQVTEIQVMDEQTALALVTTVGATVYYKGGRKLEPSNTADKLLIEQKEVLDTYRPFAMARVQEAIDMKNEVTLQGIEDAFTRQREELKRSFDIAAQDKKQKHEAALSVAEVKATGTEARATAQVKGQEDRQTLNLKYKAEADEAVKSHERDLEIMDATLWNEQQKIRSSTEASRFLGQINWDLEMAATEQKQSFAANQAALDRAVKVGDMELTANLQTQANLIQAEMVDVQRQQMQMDWIMGLISNPTTLYMVKQAGLLGTLGNIGGADVESAVSQVLAAVPERSLSNIQNVNARSDFENEIDSFTVAMQRGMSSEAYKGYISGTAPYTRGQESRMAAGRPTDYSEFITGPTTAADIEGPDIASGFYSPEVMSDLATDEMTAVEALQQEGRKILADTGEAVSEGFDTTAAYKMAMGTTSPTISWTEGMGEEAMERGAQRERDAMGHELYTGFTMNMPTTASFATKGGNAQMFMLDDAPTQIIRAIPDISMNEAQEMSRRAMNVAGSDDQFGESDEDVIRSAYGIVQSWVRGYGVYAINDIWYDRLKTLGHGREGAQKASAAREAYREELGDPAKGTGALFRQANR